MNLFYKLLLWNLFMACRGFIYFLIFSKWGTLGLLLWIAAGIASDESLSSVEKISQGLRHRE